MVARGVYHPIVYQSATSGSYWAQHAIFPGEKLSTSTDFDNDTLLSMALCKWRGKVLVEETIHLE